MLVWYAIGEPPICSILRGIEIAVPKLEHQLLRTTGPCPHTDDATP